MVGATSLLFQMYTKKSFYQTGRSSGGRRQQWKACFFNKLIGFYEAGDLVGIADFPHVTRALEMFVARPAVARGIGIPKRA